MAAIPPGTELSRIPLTQNPNGDPPNFVNPPTQEVVALAVGLPLAIISACFVSVRLITNFKVAHKLGSDDYLCIFAQIMCTVYLGLVVSLRDTNRHEYDIPLSFINESYVKKEFAQNVIIGPTLWSSKATMLALYIRLFAPKRWLRYTCYTGLLITFLFYWANTPLAVAYCTPRHGGPWSFEVLNRCSILAVMGPIQGAVGLAADILILVLPLPIIYRLNMTTAKRTGLCIVFLVGIFAVIASTVSLYFRITLYTGTDKFWNSANLWACIFAEFYVTIIVSCAPAMSSFWLKTFTKSAFYYKLRSSYLFSRASRSTATGSSSASALQKQSPYPGSSNVANNNNGYHELYDGAFSKPDTDIHSSGTRPSVDRGIITKSTTIAQVSEMKE